MISTLMVGLGLFWPFTAVRLAPALVRAAGAMPSSRWQAASITPSLSQTTLPAASQTPTFSSTSGPSALRVERRDVQKDEQIDQADINLIASHWLQTGAPGWIDEDINEDGVIDTDEIILIGLCMGPIADCMLSTTPTPSVIPTPTSSSTASPTPFPPFTSTSTFTPTVTSTQTVNTAQPLPGTITPNPVSSTQPPIITITTTPTAMVTSTGSIPTQELFPSAILEISVPQEPVLIGQQFSVEIQVSSMVPSRGASIGIMFDPSYLRCESVQEGAFYRDWANGSSTIMMPSDSCDNTHGMVIETGIILLGGSGGPTGNGVILSVIFTALSQGSSNLTMQNPRLADAAGHMIELAYETIQPIVVTTPTPSPVQQAPTATETINPSTPTPSATHFSTPTTGLPSSTLLPTLTLTPTLTPSPLPTNPQTPTPSITSTPVMSVTPTPTDFPAPTTTGSPSPSPSPVGFSYPSLSDGVLLGLPDLKGRFTFRWRGCT